MEVSEFARTTVVTADRDTSASDIAAEMADSGVGSVVVVDESRPVGIVTDRRLALALGDGGDLSEATAGDLMTEELVTVGANADVFEVVERFESEDVRRLPVVDPNGNLAGVVSLDDVVVTLTAELGRVADVIRAQSPDF